MEPVIWEELENSEGRLYYDNGIRTQWEKPKGWIQRQTESGQVYYNNGEKTQWEDPRINVAQNNSPSEERKQNANLRARNTGYANNMNLEREAHGARNKLKGTKKQFGPQKPRNLPAPPVQRKEAHNTRRANKINLDKEAQAARNKLKGTKKQFGPKKPRNLPSAPQVVNKLVNLSRKLKKKPKNRSTLKQIIPILAALTAIYSPESSGNTSRLHGRSLGPVRQPFSPARPELWGNYGAFPRPSPGAAPKPTPTPTPAPTPAPTPRPRRRTVSSIHEKLLQSFINAGAPQKTINEMIEMWEGEANALNAQAAAAAAKKAKQNQRNREVQQQLKATREGFQRVARNLGR
jgi:hypothetical protein